MKVSNSSSLLCVIGKWHARLMLVGAIFPGRFRLHVWIFVSRRIDATATARSPVVVGLFLLLFLLLLFLVLLPPIFVFVVPFCMDPWDSDDDAAPAELQAEDDGKVAAYELRAMDDDAAAAEPLLVDACSTEAPMAGRVAHDTGGIFCMDRKTVAASIFLSAPSKSSNTLSMLGKYCRRNPTCPCWVSS